MSDTPDTDAFITSQDYSPTGHQWRNFTRKLERERDEYKQERDEAREDASHWKIEYEIVEARLCGGKHERDNGIVSEREIIPKLQRERDEAIELLKYASTYSTTKSQEDTYKFLRKINKLEEVK